MFSAADLLEALRRRRTLKSIRPEQPGRLPPGWEHWLAQMPARRGAVTGAPPDAYVDLFARRPLRAPPRRGETLTRWQSFGTLWRQQWHGAGPEDRGLRIFAMATSLTLHACFAVLLAWLMYLHFLMLLPMAAGEASVVQVEYIGTGTPEDTGGGDVLPVRETADAPAQQAAAAPATRPASPSPSPSTAAAPAEPVPAPALPELPVDVAAPAVAATAPPLPQREIPTPALPATAQPLQVTEVEQLAQRHTAVIAGGPGELEHGGALDAGEQVCQGAGKRAMVGADGEQIVIAADGDAELAGQRVEEGERIHLGAQQVLVIQDGQRD